MRCMEILPLKGLNYLHHNLGFLRNQKKMATGSAVLISLHKRNMHGPAYLPIVALSCSHPRTAFLDQGSSI